MSNKDDKNSTDSTDNTDSNVHLFNVLHTRVQFTYSLHFLCTALNTAGECDTIRPFLQARSEALAKEGYAIFHKLPLSEFEKFSSPLLLKTYGMCLNTEEWEHLKDHEQAIHFVHAGILLLSDALKLYPEEGIMLEAANFVESVQEVMDVLVSEPTQRAKDLATSIQEAIQHVCSYTPFVKIE